MEKGDVLDCHNDSSSCFVFLDVSFQVCDFIPFLIKLARKGIVETICS